MNIFSWENLLNKQVNNFEFSIGTGVTVGCFDGFHLGHQKIFKKLVENCKKNKLIPGFITFGKQNSIIKSSALYSGCITKNEDYSIIEKLFPEIQFCVVINFTPEFAKMSGEDFFLKLKSLINLEYIAEGTDFKCGYKGSMGMNEILEFSTKNSIKCDFIPPVFLDSYPLERISSSLIRRFIFEGKFSIVNKMLGYDYNVDFSNIKFYFDSEKQLYFVEKESIYQILPEQGEYIVKSDRGIEKLLITKTYIYCSNEIYKAFFIES